MSTVSHPYMSLDQFEELLKIARRNGAMAFKFGDIEVSLNADAPQPEKVEIGRSDNTQDLDIDAIAYEIYKQS